MKKTVSVLLSVLTALAILTGSIAVPILLRPFYYAHIKPMQLTQYGLSETEIKEAFDEVMDYCLGISDEFSAGKLPFSEAGASHFADVRGMFIADIAVFAVCILIVIALKAIKYKPHRFLNHSPAFWGAVGLIVVSILIGVFVAIDFNSVFMVFHKLFFPGKTNWVFYPTVDPIIRYLPEAFFRNCAILIFSLMVIVSAVIIACDIKKVKTV